MPLAATSVAAQPQAVSTAAAQLRTWQPARCLRCGMLIGRMPPTHRVTLELTLTAVGEIKCRRCNLLNYLDAAAPPR